MVLDVVDEYIRWKKFYLWVNQDRPNKSSKVILFWT
jgi:hypothetical protein